MLKLTNNKVQNLAPSLHTFVLYSKMYKQQLHCPQYCFAICSGKSCKKGKHGGKLKRQRCGLRCLNEASDDEMEAEGTDPKAEVKSWELLQLMVVIWCITLPLGYGGIDTVGRLAAKNADNLSSLQKAGFAGVNEMFQIISVLYWLRSRDLGRSLLHRMRRSLRQANQQVFLEGVAAGVAAAALLSCISLLPTGSISNDDAAKQIILGSDPTASAALLASTLLLAPLLEEIIYRGVFLEGLSCKASTSIALYKEVIGIKSQNSSQKTAILHKEWASKGGSALLCQVAVSSAAFAASHLNLRNLMPLTALGVCLGSSYCSKKHSIARSFVAHAVYNLIAVKLAA